MITTENLTKTYKSHKAVDGLNLNVQTGEIYGFLGPNGAGKTTTIHMLLGLVRPSCGLIKMFGESITAQDFTFRRYIGVVAEEPVDSSHMSGWELAQMFAGLNGVPSPEARMATLFRHLDLWEARHSRARDYSRGMRQKLSLIRALVHNPQLLMLDEPVSGLDPVGIQQVRELINTYRNEGGTVFISSHILSEIEHTADRIGILISGRLIVEETMSGIRRHLMAHRQILVELEHWPIKLIALIAQIPHVIKTEITGRILSISLSTDIDLRPQLSRLIGEANCVILGMQVVEISLQEAFVMLTSKNIASTVV